MERPYTRSAWPVTPAIRFAALLVASGSGGQARPGPQNITAVGTYRLVSVNGAPVPGPFDSFSPTPGVRMEMVAVRGAIILNDDGTYLHEHETRLRHSQGNDIVGMKNVVGMYTLNAGELTFRPYQGTSYSPGYAPGRIEVVTEAPGLDGRTDRFVWRFER